MPVTPRILIIAGSDSGGGAGIQADIKTVTMLGGHAMTAITAVTAQNTLGVQAVMPVPTEMVIAQIESCVADIGVDAIKIGMLGSAETAHAVADWLEQRSNTISFPGAGRGPATGASTLDPGLRRGSDGEGRTLPIVFDPVMVATSGDTLADADTIAAFQRLIALATVSTPNPDELCKLSGSDDRSDLGVYEAAGELAERYSTAILATGTRITGGIVFEAGTSWGDRYSTNHLLFDRLFSSSAEKGFETWHWEDKEISSPHTHGTGCTLASAVATYLGYGATLSEAIGRARNFVRLAIRDAPGLGQGQGPMGHQTVRLDLGPGARLNQMTLPMTDCVASGDFYRTLGLTQIVATDDGHYARFEAPGGATLSIEMGAAPTIFFECEDLDAEVARLQSAGLVFDHLPVEQDWLWREARLTDPAGNSICLYQADENRRYPPWRLPSEPRDA
jgi:hydroxymethylpyrimidine/phosphomethylpyrimidine kinase